MERYFIRQDAQLEPIPPEAWSGINPEEVVASVRQRLPEELRDKEFYSFRAMVAASDISLPDDVRQRVLATTRLTELLVDKVDRRG